MAALLSLGVAKKKQSTPLSADAIAALRASAFDGNTFKLPDGNLECYHEIKALMGALGGKWVSGKKHMAFAEGVNCQQLVFAACDRGEIPPSNPLDFFPTPPDVVAEIAAYPWLLDRWNGREHIAEDRPMRYLEPSGGSGALAEVMASRLRPQDELVICEMNPLLADLLRNRFPRASVIEGDFLEYRDDKGFDVILMNPPFDGKSYRKHVEHAESMLRRFGALVAIVPSQFKTHGDDFLYHVAEAGEWHDFGPDRFEGTKTPTSALFIENHPDSKWREKPCDGYSNHHAWDAAMSLANDGDLLGRVCKAENLAGATRCLEEWALRQLQDGHCIRIDKDIAREVVTSVLRDYDQPALSRLLPKEQPPMPADEAPIMHVLAAPEFFEPPMAQHPAPASVPKGPAHGAKAEQGEFALF